MHATEYYVGSELGKLISGDLNGDGKPEVMVVDVMDDGFYFLRNTSTVNTVTMTSAGRYASNQDILDITLADLDGDNMNEIILCKSYSYYQEIHVLRNISNIQNFGFATPFIINNGHYPRKLAANDINADGKPDIISTDDYSNTISFYINKSTPGSLLFGDKLSFATGRSPKGLTFGDLNGDGIIELGVGTDSRSVECFTIKNNSGNIVLEPFLHLRPSANDPVDSINRYPMINKMVDLDLDGKPELISSTTSSPLLSIFRNRVN